VPLDKFLILVGIWAGANTVVDVPTVVEIAVGVDIPLIRIAVPRVEIRRRQTKQQFIDYPQND